MKRNPIKFYVVEDEPSNRQGIIDLINNHEDTLVIGDASTVDDAFIGIFNTAPDALMLDVKLIGGDAFMLLRRLMNQRVRIPPTILITGHFDFELASQALNEFREHVVHILQKPFLENWEEKYVLILDKIRCSQPASKNHVFIIKSKSQTHRLKLEEVEYIEVGGNGSIIIHRDFGKPVKMYQTLNKFLLTAPKTIIRIHRKYAVNKDKVDYVDHEDRLIYLAGHQKGIDIGEVFYSDINNLIA